MALETAQILSTALYISGYEDTPYTPSYPKHPCVLWAAESLANWEWLLSYLAELNIEYKRRFLRDTDIQPYRTIAASDCLKVAQSLLPKGSMTDFPNCSGLPDSSVFEAYKALLRQKWSDTRRTARWTNAFPPSWKNMSQ